MVLMGSKKVGATTINDLVAFVKANPGKVSIGTSGVGSANHLCSMLFQQAYNLQLTSVPYKGAAPAAADLQSGQLDLLCDQTITANPLVKDGKAKGFVVSSPERQAGLSSVPTTKEAGVTEPLRSISIWNGLYAPAGTPKEVVTKLNNAIQAVLKDPATAQKFKEMSLEMPAAKVTSPEGHKKFLEAEIAKWAVVIQKAGEFIE